MRTRAQAARVAALGSGLGARQELVTLPDSTTVPGRTVWFPEHERPQAFDVASSVSTLFEAVDDDGVVLDTGWSVRGMQFEVEWPDDPSVVRSHFGARRFAYNWGLAQVKSDMDAREADPTHESVKWDLASLRKAFNAAKDEDAPWWAENSKEAYASGLDDLATALGNWRSSRSGTRKGARVGFPRFRSRRRDKARVRFTTGTMRLEDDRRHITLPVIGRLRSKENTRRLQRHLAKGRARILSMTLSERWGRLFVSVNYALHSQYPESPALHPGGVVGVDLGLRTLATTSDNLGDRREFANPKPLRATLVERRRVARHMSRCIPDSRAHRQARAKLARLDRHAVMLRRESAHQLTRWLADTYGEVHIEDLDLAAMKKSMGRRAFRRSVSDAALGLIRPMLADKVARKGGELVVVDRWYPSSQLHHGCGCRLQGKGRIDKHLACRVTGELVDRDHNAADNLRDWPGHASLGRVAAQGPNACTPGGGTGDVGPASAHAVAGEAA